MRPTTKDPERSRLIKANILFTATGVAALLVAMIFACLPLTIAALSAWLVTLAIVDKASRDYRDSRLDRKEDDRW